MSCAPFDLKDYFLEELDPAGRAAIERHLDSCATCREEVKALQLTRSALLSVADEELPRRIAFVSDRVFEPRWWQKLWHSGPQLGFASAALVAAALLVHAFVPKTQPVPVVAPVDTAAVERYVQAEVAKRLDTAVAKVVAESEERQTAKVLEVVNTRLKESNARHRDDFLLVKEYLERSEKRNAMFRRAVYDIGDTQ
jgi:anti-sigma factor RsiW